MILIGQYDSPFVRRVGIALELYGIAFEHRPWSVFREAEKIAAYNPLLRVPTLVLDDGTVLTESTSILDYLDGRAAPAQALIGRTEPARHRALRVVSLAMGAADKAVSLFYEKRLHTEVSDIWVNRCRTQIAATLALLEAERAKQTGSWWFGDRMGHADIAVAVAWRFISEAHADLASAATYPRLADDSRRLEALPVFKTISQPFAPPA